MKCLSLWQPWATLLVSGAKKIETRSWATTYQGPLLIHAPAKMDDASMSLLSSAPHFAAAFSAYGFTAWHQAYGHLPFGAIVGIVDLDLCVQSYGVRNGYPAFLANGQKVYDPEKPPPPRPRRAPSVKSNFLSVIICSGTRCGLRAWMKRPFPKLRASSRPRSSRPRRAAMTAAIP